MTGTLARTTDHRPRQARTAGTASTSAAIPTRSSTMAPLLQPVVSSALAKGPDVPNAAAVTTAATRPRSARRTGRRPRRGSGILVVATVSVVIGPPRDLDPGKPAAGVSWVKRLILMTVGVIPVRSQDA